MDRPVILTRAAPARATQAVPYQALTFDICESMARLANPANTTGLTPEVYRQAVAALNAARTEAVARADRQPLAAARQTICFALALTAALSTLDLLLATPATPATP